MMAALPSWLRVKRTRRTPAAIVVELNVDITAFSAALRRASDASADASRAMRLFGQTIARAGTNLTDILDADARPIWGAVESHHPRNQWLANHQARKRNALEARMAGLEARWYVRGALDPAYATEAARDAAVQALLIQRRSGAWQPEVLAAAFLRGWAEHRAGQSEPYALHRVWERRMSRPSTIVQVVAA